MTTENRAIDDDEFFKAWKTDVYDKQPDAASQSDDTPERKAPELGRKQDAAGQQAFRDGLSTRAKQRLEADKQDVTESPTKSGTTESDMAKAAAEYTQAWGTGDDVMPATTTATPPKAQSFGSAFAQARKDGLKVFDWNGKRYTTALKGEGKAPAPATKPRAPAPATAPEMKDGPLNGRVTGPRQGLSSQYLAARQLAYDQWMEAKAANTTWWGGKAQPSPTRLQNEIEAERRYNELLRNPR